MTPRPFARSILAISTLSCAVLVLGAGCDSGKKKEEAKAETEDEAKAEAPTEAEPEPAEKKGLAAGEVALPWMYDDVKASIKGGSKYVYALSGKDAEGKEVSDTFECKVKSTSDADAGIACARVDNPAKGAGELATVEWSQFSPMFALEKPEHELLERAEVEVPAGKFDTVVVELKDFFGNRKKVWMVVDQPGVYAQVVELPNAGAEDDQTELTYALKEVATP